MKSRNDRPSRRGAAVLAIAFASHALGAADLAVDIETPEATVRSLHAGLVAVAAEHGDAPLEERRAALEPLVAATHDLPYIAEFSIRRQWRELSADERARFADAFARLSVTTYAARFGGVSEASFAMGESEVLESGRAEVQTSIARADGTAVPLDYTLQRADDGGWRIVNIVADGVSDLALKRAEYQRVLAGGSIDDLIRHLDAQTAELR